MRHIGTLSRALRGVNQGPQCLALSHSSLILSSQASARSSIVGNMASSLTAQSAFLNNFESVVNRRVDIREDIKRYQDTLSYA